MAGVHHYSSMRAAKDFIARWDIVCNKKGNPKPVTWVREGFSFVGRYDDAGHVASGLPLAPISS
jgi:hypothetical protein